ncbi:hypothetical protein, partial [Thiolapillus sp.]|uniref:hypothetical protein n=1 Tax=Thiolapillus sp. TaxID=2017437 RepID=UPI003AF57917
MCKTDVILRRCIDVHYAKFERNICVIIFVTPSTLPLHIVFCFCLCKTLRASKGKIVVCVKNDLC